EELRIQLDREHPPGRVREPGGEAPGPGPHFQNAIVPAQFRGANDEVEQVEVDEEVLPHLVFRDEATRLEQALDIGEGLAGGWSRLVGHDRIIVVGTQSGRATFRAGWRRAWQACPLPG